MHRHYFSFIVALAIGCVLLVIFSFLLQQHDETVAKITTPVAHPISPFPSHLFAAGIVEAISGNISIGTPYNRTIDKIFVSVGSKIKKGEPLFSLENRDLFAELKVRKMAYERSMAQWNKMKALPRPEKLAQAEATSLAAQAELAQAKSEYAMVQGLSNRQAISQEENNRRFYNYRRAQANWQKAEASLNEVKAGEWMPDVEIAHLALLQAQAEMAQIETQIEQTTICSPIDGEVLQIKSYPGEMANDSSRTPVMIVGNTSELFLQVSINQFEVPYYNPYAAAIAFLQGNARLAFALEFVRLEPYLSAKTNLTNELTEKVDTRILRATYRIKNHGDRLFVGQQMDVFIETKK